MVHFVYFVVVVETNGFLLSLTMWSLGANDLYTLNEEKRQQFCNAELNQRLP